MPKTRHFSSGEEAIVRVVHVKDPHDFYVRLTADDNWVTTFQSLAENYTPPRFLLSPSAEQPVLLQHENYGWARGMVTRVESNGLLRIQTLDYGETLTVMPRVLRRLDFADVTAPKAIHCRLHRCEPTSESWSAASVKSFIDYLGAGPLKMTVMKLTPTGDQYVVELSNNYETISKMLVIAGVACLGGHPQDINRIEPHVPTPVKIQSSFKYSSLTVDNETSVIILKVQRDNIFVIREEMYEGILLASDLVEAEFEDCKHLDATGIDVGTPIAFHQRCRGKKVYYRAEILAKKLQTNGKYLLKLLLVDHGGIKTVLTAGNKIRKCNSLLLELETLAITCKLNKAQWSQCGIQSLLTSGLRLVVKAERPKNEQMVSQDITIVQDYLPKMEK